MTDRLDDAIFGATGSAVGDGGSGTGAGGNAPGTPGQSGRSGGGRNGRQSGAGPTGGKRRPRAGAAHVVRRIITLVLALGLVGGAGYVAVGYVKPLVEPLFAAKDFTGTGTTPVTFVVNPGDSGSTIATNLETAGIVKSAGAFESALDDNGKAIQPGSFSLKKEMSAASALAALRDEKNRNVKKVTIREGLWRSEIFALLAKATGTPVADYVEAAKTPESIGLPAYAKGNIEGYLFPATYEINPDDDASAQLQMLVKQAVSQLDALGIPEAKRQRTLIIASIVEAEARLAADRPKVARVVENRLRIKMKLQLDSTVSYGVQRRSITTTDKERANNNPSNTYLHAGLPAGPIDNPGVASLKAALSPTPGAWLYFLAVNPTTGATRFAVTAAEHNANVVVFQRWCAANPGTC